MNRRNVLTSRSRGFTLIELIVVVAIIVIVMGVSAPRVIRSVRFGELKGNAQQLLTTVRYAQGLSAVHRATYRLHLNLDRNSFTLSADPSRGDDFELTDSDLMSGGESSLFPGERRRTSPDSWSERQEEDDEFFGDTPSSSTNTANPLAIFDDEGEFVCDGSVDITRVIDGRGDEIIEGEFEVPFSPQGGAVATEIHLELVGGGPQRYVVVIGANGHTELYSEDTKK